MTPPLTPADPADLEEAVHYALRFGLTGKPHGKRIREDGRALAAVVVVHLAQANYRVFRGPPLRDHTAGGDRPGRVDGRGP
ncbi:hypothetical protein FHS87_004437 [Roseomonas pecuniae]|uniref:Uncharacterized protein n=1 Tax=Muricoccus pecuniae TaxID=693023 RepID=A0A840Y894_9PROT|nr:hypothetical protein [Roseomonas pecuniae]